MRLILISVTAIAIVLAGVMIASAGPEHDTTRDGVVDLRDALDVLSHFGEAPGTPTPVPSITGDRALITLGNFAATKLIDTSTGAEVAVLTNPGVSLRTKPLGTSCDGELVAVSQYQTSSSIRLVVARASNGDVLLDTTLPWQFAISSPGEKLLFPCPVKAAGGAFAAGGPVRDRAVYVSPWSGPSCCQVMVFDLSTGTQLTSRPTTGDAWLSCAQDVVLYPPPDNQSTRLVRLSDGVEFASVPGYPGVSPTC